jgi:hypothetical protein
MAPKVFKCYSSMTGGLMKIGNNIEQVVCLMRADEQVSEAVLRDAVRSFKPPMPVTLNVNGMPSGCWLVSVDIRHDDQGAFMAGLIRSEKASAAIRKELSTQGKLVSVGFVPTSTEPK